MITMRVSGMTIRAPFVLFWLLELAICMLAVLIAVMVRFVGDTALISDQFDSPWLSTLAFGGIMTISLVCFGLYQSHFRGGALGVLLRIALGFAAGGVALALPSICQLLSRRTSNGGWPLLAAAKTRPLSTVDSSAVQTGADSTLSTTSISSSSRARR